MVVNPRYFYKAKLVAFFAAYYITGVVGLNLNSIHNYATLIWAPSGIALAAIFMLGFRAWPIITLAAFLVNLTTGAKPAVALSIALGNTLAALTAVYLLRKYSNFKPDLERGKDVLGLVLYGAFFSTLISATVGSTTLLANKIIQAGQYRETWVAWWVGDMLGILIVAPLIFIWTERSKLEYSRKQLYEFLIVATGLILVCAFVFKGYGWLGINEQFPRYYLIFPPLIWIALRFGRRGAVSASFTVAVLAIGTTLAGLSNLPEIEIGKNLIYVQGFIGVTAITILTLSAIVAERENTVTTQKSLERRAKTLASQRKNLMALNQSKDEFVAITSHQLRTPATAVKQYLGLLLQGYTEPLSKNQRTFLRRAYEENIRQLHIIDELLLTTRLDLGKVILNKEPSEPAQIIAQTLESLKSKLSERKQKVIFKKPKKSIVVNCDPKHIRSVVDNLLENASNYSEAGKTIHIGLRQLKDIVQITIADEGVGIDPADYSKLFQKFSRIPNKLSNTVNGTGLGLYFSLKIIELHRGKIKVDAVKNGGTRFTIQLPV